MNIEKGERKFKIGDNVNWTNSNGNTANRAKYIIGQMLDHLEEIDAVHQIVAYLADTWLQGYSGTKMGLEKDYFLWSNLA
jgi:hypothetical protein